MDFKKLIQSFIQQDSMTESTMMGTPCLRYSDEFVAMFFDKEDSLIIKVSPDRVIELIGNGQANEFNYTKKRFKEWALVPIDYEEQYSSYIEEAIEYAKLKLQQKQEKALKKAQKKALKN